MSTRSSILYHRDEERMIDIHVYEELDGDSPQDIRLEIEFDHAVINVPWPLGLTLEQVQGLAIQPDPERKRFGTIGLSCFRGSESRFPSGMTNN
jgi:hypothetical protein